MIKCDFCNECCKNDHCSFYRLDCNLSILRELEDFFKKNPDIRFTQALYSMGIDLNSDFYEEPPQTLSKIRKFLQS